jgi:hypothetical protein
MPAMTGDTPGGSDSEERVERHGDRGDEEREADRLQRIRGGECDEIGGGAFGEGLGEDQRQRHDEKQQKQHQRRPDESGAQGATFADLGLIRHGAADSRAAAD